MTSLADCVEEFKRIGVFTDCGLDPLDGKKSLLEVALLFARRAEYWKTEYDGISRKLVSSRETKVYRTVPDVLQAIDEFSNVADAADVADVADVADAADAADADAADAADESTTISVQPDPVKARKLLRLIS